MKIRLLKYAAIALSTVLIAYVAISRVYLDNGKEVMVSNSTVDIPQKQPSNQERATPLSQLCNKKLILKADTKLANTKETLDPLLEGLNDEIFEVFEGEAEKYLKTEQAVPNLFAEKEYKLYDNLISKVKFTSNIHDISRFVDLVTCVAERYDPNSQSKDIVYRVVVKALHALENSKLYSTSNTKTELQRMRLLVWKYHLEQNRKGFHGSIPPMDDDAGKRDYVQLQQIETTTEIDKYLKTALLYQAELPMTSSLTQYKSLDDLLEMQPKISNKREAVDIARIRAWALFEWANLRSPDVKELLPLRGVYYQYVIDFYETIADHETFWALNDQDEEHFENLVKKAVNGLSEVRKRCEPLGVNLEEKLSRRKSVNHYFKYLF